METENIKQGESKEPYKKGGEKVELLKEETKESVNTKLEPSFNSIVSEAYKSINFESGNLKTFLQTRESFTSKVLAQGKELNEYIQQMIDKEQLKSMDLFFLGAVNLKKLKLEASQIEVLGKKTKNFVLTL